MGASEETNINIDESSAEHGGEMVIKATEELSTGMVKTIENTGKIDINALMRNEDVLLLKEKTVQGSSNRNGT